MDRGIRASIDGIELAKKALKTKGWTQDYLAGSSNCSRQTVIKFFARKPIEKRIFQAICIELEKEWGNISELEPKENPDRPLNLDELVETIRINIYDNIQTKCGTMRVLDMTQPIDLNAIYTNVNILEKITGRQRLEYQELMESCCLENFDRFSLSGVQEACIPALDAVKKYDKLMILGKPGSGKTTFLKDEVRQADSKRVLQQIQGFSDLFAKNIFAITCRIAAREYTFEKFTEVEVTDFDDGQIATFTKQWFKTKNDPVKAKKIIEKLKKEPGIRELASSPLLLTLLCLVFGESGSFPSNRSELYKEGLDVLLKKWDVKRNIERDRVYHNLSLQRKEDLLSQIALDTFEQGKYFFKQKELEQYITKYIRNLPDVNIEEDAIQLDSEAVLKSIEYQHGLFVERAREIYSFSHLTFHEYFTARKFGASTYTDILVQKLTAYVTDKRWREVFLLTSEMLENADLLLRSMKQEIDSILNQDRKLQKFLVWVEQKSCATKTNYKPAAVRIYFLNCVCKIDRVSKLAHTRTDTLDSTFTVAEVLDRNRIRSKDDLIKTLTHTDAFVNTIAEALKFADLSIILPDAFETIELHDMLQKIKTQCPDTHLTNNIDLYNWWKVNGRAWTENLKYILNQDRNIGHDWQFSEAQNKLLQQYYDANQLLIDCLNSDCYVSREVREEIESTLLLPIESIHKRKSR